MSKNPNKKLNYLALNSKTITNNQGIILADGKASLISDEDFINKNGSVIKANDVTVTSINGNIINQTFAQTNKVQMGSNDFTYTLLGNESKIESTNGNLVLNARNNIENIGANLEASKTLSLTAQIGDVNFKTLRLENGHNVYFKGGFDKALDIEHQSATASAGENVIIQAGNNVNLENAKIDATNQINLNAQNDVNITAINDIHYTDVQTSKKGTITSIKGNITLNGKNNIENIGSFLKYIKILDYNKLTNYIK